MGIKQNNLLWNWKLKIIGMFELPRILKTEMNGNRLIETNKPI